MAFQISALFSHIRVLPTAGPLSRSRVDFQCVGVKFKHFLSLQLPKRPLHASVGVGRNLPTSLLPGHINTANRVGKFSTTTATLRQSGQGHGSSPRGKRGLLGRIALGALGVTAAAVVCLHTGTLVAMAQKVNLNSAEGDWKEAKDFLLSLSVEERRQHYRTSNYEPLDNIPVWTPTPVSNGAEQSRYHRNEKLDRKISLYSGDITKLEIDAIVNAANKTLLGGGGVDGAIHRAAGPKLKKECASLHGCETGQAKITCGYGLPAKYVIHTVGPIAMGGVGEEERAALRSCYRNSLETAAASHNAARSVAFPCISTGIYGYPPEQAVHEALATVREYLDEHHDKLDRVIFCVFLPMDKELYLKTLPLYFPGAPTEATVKSKL
ncbi:ADP-ribose glycohydrolase MACROD1 isoform X2 [Centroberyx gerrardi]|uniref:ADP-ribose glycohydrolase MACROD1 isoform X1 n=1 Tax=Centroberyx gerrardi TaxID=166262 RepID=UPI003AAD4C25